MGPKGACTSVLGVAAFVGAQLPFGSHISLSGFFQGRLGSPNGDRHENRAEKMGGGVVKTYDAEGRENLWR